MNNKATEAPELRTENPFERQIEAALIRAGELYTTDHDGSNASHLDFCLTNRDIHIEVKTMHSGRVAEQMSRVSDVIVAQGQRAIAYLVSLIARVDPPAAPTVLLDPAGLAEAFEENDRYQALLLKWFVKPADPRGYLIYEGAFEGDEQAAIAYQHAWSIAESIAEKHNARLATPIFAPPAPDEADKALAREIIGNVDNYAEEHTGELSISAFGPLSQRIAAALAQARKEGAQPVHPDDLADTINKFLFEQYACTIDHPQMHVLKELVQWWPDPASKQER